MNIFNICGSWWSSRCLHHSVQHSNSKLCYNSLCAFQHVSWRAKVNCKGKLVYFVLFHKYGCDKQSHWKTEPHKKRYMKFKSLVFMLVPSNCTSYITRKPVIKCAASKGSMEFSSCWVHGLNGSCCTKPIHSVINIFTDWRFIKQHVLQTPEKSTLYTKNKGFVRVHIICMF